MNEGKLTVEQELEGSCPITQEGTPSWEAGEHKEAESPSLEGAVVSFLCPLTQSPLLGKMTGSIL